MEHVVDNSTAYGLRQAGPHPVDHPPQAPELGEGAAGMVFTIKIEIEFSVQPYYSHSQKCWYLGEMDILWSVHPELPRNGVFWDTYIQKHDNMRIIKVRITLRVLCKINILDSTHERCSPTPVQAALTYKLIPLNILQTPNDSITN